MTWIPSAPGSPGALLRRGPSEPCAQLVAAHGSSKPRRHAGCRAGFLTFGQSPSRVALKIRCRSRRTCSSQDRQSMVSHSSTSCSKRWSSGPFTPRRAIATANACAVMSNLSFGSGGLDCSSSKAHLPHVGLLSQPGTRPGIRPVIRGDRRRGRSSSRVFLSPFGHRHSLLGHPVPPGAPAPLTVGRPRHHRHHGPERGFHVPHARDPAGIGRPLYPEGDGVDATEYGARSARPLRNGPPRHPGAAFHPGMFLSRGINKDSLHSPLQPSPHL